MLQPEISIQRSSAPAGDSINGNLLMLVTPQHFAYAVVTANCALDVYEKFSLGNGMAAVLPELVTGLPWMHKKYIQVKTAWFTREATLAPAASYKLDSARHYLNLLYGDLEPARELADFVRSENLYCVYRVPQPGLKTVVRNFPSGGSWHCLSLLLGGEREHGGDGEYLRLHFMQDACCASLYRNGRLMAAKALAFSHFMDVVFALLSLCNMHGFDPENMHTVVSGDISVGAPLYDELRKYLRHLAFSQTGFTSPEAEPSFAPHYFYMFHALNKAL